MNINSLTFRKPLPELPESDDIRLGETCYRVEVNGHAAWYRREDSKSGRLIFLRYVQDVLDSDAEESDRSDSDYEADDTIVITADQLARIHAFGLAYTEANTALSRMFQAGNGLLG